MHCYMHRTARLILLLCLGAIESIFGVACEQRVDLPVKGMTQKEVMTKIGPPASELTDRGAVEVNLKMVSQCSSDHVSDVSALWLYERNLKKSVVVAFDRERRVLCAGHGGVTFISQLSDGQSFPECCDAPSGVRKVTIELVAQGPIVSRKPGSLRAIASQTRRAESSI